MYYPKERSTWGVNLKTFLRNEGRSIKWFSKKTGIRYGRLLDILGGREPGLDEAAKISNTLGIDPLKFYKKENNNAISRRAIKLGN